MNSKIKKFLLAVIIIFTAETLLWAGYDSDARLLVRNLHFCASKPRGLGNFNPVGEEGFNIGESAYLYMEAENCKSEKAGNDYSLYIIIDLDIYYEEGNLIFSESDVKSFTPESIRNFSKTYLWVKIDTRYLMPGEYKAEVKVRDQNSGKEGFALKKFNVK